MTASHILLQVTCLNATESDFQNFRTNWTNFRTLSEFQDISGHFLKFQEFQDCAQAWLWWHKIKLQNVGAGDPPIDNPHRWCTS